MKKENAKNHFEFTFPQLWIYISLRQRQMNPTNEFCQLRISQFIFLTALILLSSSHTFAQWGAHYQFSFVLSDANNNFNSQRDRDNMKWSKEIGSCDIHFNRTTYTLLTDQFDNVRIAQGLIHIRYFTVHQEANLHFRIVKTQHKESDTLFVKLSKLPEGVYAEIPWKSGNAEVDLSHGRNINYFSGYIPKYDDDSVDITCLIQGTCEDSSLRGSDGFRELIERNTRVETVQQTLNTHFDSLIDATFDKNVFQTLFELECETGFYNRYSPQKCQLKMDTSLYSIKRIYRLKNSTSNPQFRLVIQAHLNPAKAYFINHLLTARKHGIREFQWQQESEIAKLAKKRFPDLEFQKDEAGNPIVSFRYLNAEPMSVRPGQGAWDEIPIQRINKDIKAWPGTFAYVLQTTQKEGVNADVCNELIYYSASNAKFIKKTSYCYSLLDE